MKIEYDQNTCTGMFQCIHEWEAFEQNLDTGKADLNDATETDDGVFVRNIPESEEFDAKMAARVCPVDAITIYDDDGNKLLPK